MIQVVSLLVVLAAFLSLAGSVVATPTKPFVSEVSKLPKSYLLQVGEGDWKVKVSGKDCSKERTSCKVLAEIQHNASANDLGWEYVRVKSESYYHAGYLEGFVTAKSIALILPTNSAPSPRALTWVQEHILYMRTKSNATGRYDPFWASVGKLLDQVQGLADGYSAATNTTLTFTDVFLLNFADEIGDVETHIHLQSGKYKKDELIMPNPNGMHCSAMIRPTKDDMFMAHDTWSVFQQLAYRQFKMYDLEGVQVTLSGYPGTIASGDDWYMTSHQLAVQETTNDVFNTSLFSAVLPTTVSEFIRVMTANYLTKNGADWTAHFARENSGTYNNQYMVVDWKNYVPGSDIVRDTLWIAEQIPGYIERRDVSDVLRKQGYWASYNIPYFFYIYDVSGYKQVYEQQGSFWSYTKYARPEIFRRNHSLIHDVSDMMRMMRYNDYKVDPFSIISNCTGAVNNTCNPKHSSMLTVASRGDLMVVYNTTQENIAHYGPLYGLVAQGCFGALDTKIASYKHRYDMTPYVIAGPTNDQQPTFEWGENAVCPMSLMPPSSPKRYDFPWIEFRL